MVQPDPCLVEHNKPASHKCWSTQPGFAELTLSRIDPAINLVREDSQHVGGTDVRPTQISRSTSWPPGRQRREAMRLPTICGTHTHTPPDKFPPLPPDRTPPSPHAPHRPSPLHIPPASSMPSCRTAPHSKGDRHFGSVVAAITRGHCCRIVTNIRLPTMPQRPLKMTPTDGDAAERSRRRQPPAEPTQRPRHGGCCACDHGAAWRAHHAARILEMRSGKGGRGLAEDKLFLGLPRASARYPKMLCHAVPCTKANSDLFVNSVRLMPSQRRELLL